MRSARRLGGKAAIWRPFGGRLFPGVIEPARRLGQGGDLAQTSSAAVSGASPGFGWQRWALGLYCAWAAVVSGANLDFARQRQW